MKRLLAFVVFATLGVATIGCDSGTKAPAPKADDSKMKTDDKGKMDDSKMKTDDKGKTDDKAKTDDKGK